MGQVRRRRSSSTDEDGDDVEVSWRGHGLTCCNRLPHGPPFSRGRGSGARLFPLVRVAAPPPPPTRRGAPAGRVGADSSSLILGGPRVASILQSLARVPPSVELVPPSVAPDPPMVDPDLPSL